MIVLNRMEAVDDEFSSFVAKIATQSNISDETVFVLFPSKTLSKVVVEDFLEYLTSHNISTCTTLKEYLSSTEKSDFYGVVYGTVEMMVASGFSDELSTGVRFNAIPKGATIYLWDADSLYDGRVQNVTLPLPASSSNDQEKMSSFAKLTHFWVSQFSKKEALLNGVDDLLLSEFLSYLLEKTGLSDSVYVRSLALRFLSAYTQAISFQQGVDYKILSGRVIWSSNGYFDEKICVDPFVHGVVAALFGAEMVQLMAGTQPLTIQASTWLSCLDAKLIGAFSLRVDSPYVNFSLTKLPKKAPLSLPDSIVTVDSKTIQNVALQSFFHREAGEKIILASTEECLSALSGLPKELKVMSHDAFLLTHADIESSEVLSLEMPNAHSTWLRLCKIEKIEHVLTKTDHRLSDGHSLRWSSNALSFSMHSKKKFLKNGVGVWRSHWGEAQRSFTEKKRILDLARYKTFTKAMTFNELGMERAALLLEVKGNLDLLVSRGAKVNRVGVWKLFLLRVSQGLNLRRLEENLSPVYLSLSGETYEPEVSEIKFWQGVLNDNNH